MTPINESERKQAITKFWGLYAVIGFSLLCILLGGFILKNSTLREAERTEFETFKANRSFTENIARRIDKLKPNIVGLFDMQYAVHSGLYPDQEDLNLTLNIYRERINAIAQEATGLNDSLQNIYTQVQKKNKDGKLADPLSESNLELIRTLLGDADTAHTQIYKAAMKLRMSRLNTIGIGTLHEGLEDASGDDPVERMHREEVEELQDKIDALMQADQNKAVAKVTDEKDELKRERDDALKDALIQKNLKEAYKNHGTASGMLEVTEKIVDMAKRNGNKLFSSRKMQEEYEKVINDYKSTIMSKLETASEKIADMNNGEAIALRTIIGNLESRVRQLSVSN